MLSGSGHSIASFGFQFCVCTKPSKTAKVVFALLEKEGKLRAGRQSSGTNLPTDHCDCQLLPSYFQLPSSRLPLPVFSSVFRLPSSVTGSSLRLPTSSLVLSASIFPPPASCFFFGLPSSVFGLRFDPSSVFRLVLLLPYAGNPYICLSEN